METKRQGSNDWAVGFGVAATLLLIVCLIVNTLGTAWAFAAHHSRWNEVLWAGGGGFLLGQVCLLVLWGVLGVESPMIRLPRSAGIAIAVFFSWLAGTHLADQAPPIQIAVVISCFALLIFSLLTLPFWFLRFVYPFRIARPNREAGADQFSIRQVMVWTAAVAGFTATGRWLYGMSDDSMGSIPMGQVWVIIFILIFISIFMVALSLPLLLGVLRPKPSRKVWACVTAVFLVSPPLLVTLIYWCIERSPSYEDRIFAMLSWYAFFFTMLVVILTGLLVARQFGFKYAVPVKPDVESVL